MLDYIARALMVPFGVVVVLVVNLRFKARMLPADDAVVAEAGDGVPFLQRPAEHVVAAADGVE